MSAERSSAAGATVIDPKVLARIAGMGLQVRQVMEGALTGQHRSPHHGSSVEFAQHREYAPGDEIRHIDWKAYAKSDRFQIKQFEDETNLRSYLVLDTSGSMDYAGKRAVARKRDYAAQVAAALSWLLLRQGDAVGLLTFGARVGRYVPPRARADHFWNLAQVMAEAPVGGPTDAVGALTRVAEVAARRSLIFLISDCFDFGESGRLAAVARQLSRRRHRVVVLQVLDPDEVDFPFRDLTLFEDLEAPDDRALADPRGMREAYLAEIQRYCDDLRRDLREGDVACHRLLTDAPLERALFELLGRPT